MNSLFTIGMRTKLSTLLFALIAVTGLVAAGCGNSGSNSTSEVLTQSPSPQAGEADTVDEQEVIPEASVQSEPATVNVDDLYDPELTCAEQFPTSEEETIQNAEAMLDQIQVSFPDIPEDDARTLALAYSLCDIQFSEVEELLEDGELGVQYRNMINAVFSESYPSFVDLYREQVCLVASFDGGVKVESDSRLNRLVGAASTAALINHLPTDDEIEAIVDTFVENFISAIYDQIIEGNAVEESDVVFDSGDPQDPDGQSEDADAFQLESTCEMVISKVAQSAS